MNFAARREALEARRQALSGRLGAQQDGAVPRFGLAWGRSAGRERQRAAAETALQELRRVEAALARLHEGSYGICLSCGDPISEARLDVKCDTPFCAKCAPAAE